MLDILRTISPSHLQILRVTFPWVKPRAVPFLPVFLPSLIELHISGHLDDSAFKESHIAPSLKRLRLHGHLSHGIKLRVHLQRICPHLTHLRFYAPYNTYRAWDTLVQFVRTYCGLPNNMPSSQEASEGTQVQQPRRFPHPVIDDAPIPMSLHRLIVDLPRKALRRHISAYVEIVAHLANDSNGIQMEEDLSGSNRSFLMLPPQAPLPGDEQPSTQCLEEYFPKVPPEEYREWGKLLTVLPRSQYGAHYHSKKLVADISTQTGLILA